MKKKRILRYCLIFPLVLLLIPNVYAGLYTWTTDPDLNSGTITDISSHWATNGYWDVKGFQWGDSDTTYPSGFSYTWQDGVVSIWVGDWEHDYWTGTTVGAVRQGSVWNLATAPWYDQTTYQPTPLHFAGKSSITLSSRVRIDSQYWTDLGWINWLFNPWFRVESTYLGVTEERKMVWDIVWGWGSPVGISTAHNYIDEDENLHLAFFLERLWRTGEWKTYTVDLLDMAEQALHKLIDTPIGLLPVYAWWQFEVDDLYLWSIDALAEGFDYDTQFSVDFLRVTYEYPPPPSNGNGGGCPYVSAWNGSQYVLDNNILPYSELSKGVDVEDYYRLEQSLVPKNGKHSLIISEFESEHSYIDQVKLLAVDHDSDVNTAVTLGGAILTYKNPVAPLSAVDNNGTNRLGEISFTDGIVSDPATYFFGEPGDYLILNFGQIDSDNAKLILRDDMYKYKQCIEVQVKDSNDNWQTVEVLVPHAYWSMEAVDLSPYVVQARDFMVRLYWKYRHRLDYVGLDTTKQDDYELHKANLVSAIHSTHGDVKALLLESDNTYAELVPGQQIKLEFTLPNNSKQARTYILYTKGHYYTI